MKRLATAAAVSLSLALAGAASAQQVKGGENGLKGTIVTGSCLAAPGTTCTVLTAPAKGGLVITTGCLTQISSGGTFGWVLNGVPMSFQCLGSFAPTPPTALPVGYVVAPGEDFECTNPASSTDTFACIASGVLTKK